MLNNKNNPKAKKGMTVCSIYIFGIIGKVSKVYRSKKHTIDIAWDDGKTSTAVDDRKYKLVAEDKP